MSYPLDRWYVAGFDWEVTDAPLGRTFLDVVPVPVLSSEPPKAVVFGATT